MDYTKFTIIFKREYLSRLKSRAFILSTILAPLGLILLIAVPVVLNLMESDQRHVIGIQDHTGAVYERLHAANPERYSEIDPATPVDTLRAWVLSRELDGFIILDDSHVDEGRSPELFSRGGGGLGLVSELRGDIRSALQNVRLDRAQVDDSIRDILAMRTGLETRKITETGEEAQDTLVLFFVGYIMFFIIYAAMFGYGAVIMRSVIEEKTNRIIEVITSSVRPFELLMGKVIGVGALGLTQFAIWSVSAAGLLAIAGPIIAMVGGGSPGADTAELQAVAAEADLPFTIPTIGADVWISFVLFFLLGYAIYSAMFAAVGAAVDSESDANQLMLPIMIPIMIPLLFIGNVASDPDSTFSVVASLFPFFAPMLMPMRVAMSPVPFWEIALGLVLCALTFLALIWISSRIYRIGILMYGNKPSFTELYRWIKYS